MTSAERDEFNRRKAGLRYGAFLGSVQETVDVRARLALRYFMLGTYATNEKLRARFLRSSAYHQAIAAEMGAFLTAASVDRQRAIDGRQSLAASLEARSNPDGDKDWAQRLRDQADDLLNVKYGRLARFAYLATAAHSPDYHQRVNVAQYEDRMRSLPVDIWRVMPALILEQQSAMPLTEEVAADIA